MRVIRRPAYQGHAIPATAGRPHGPFPAEILAAPVVTFDDNDPDDIYPPGATAQNNYRGVPLFRCRHCDAVMTEEQTGDHFCEGLDGQSE